nr:MAG: RNA dependent RNA polymerase [Ilomantsi totivirus 2]
MHPVDLYHIHQGDDVWISNRSRLWAISVFKVMQSTGFDFQPKKQMFDICRAGFLRVLYSQEGCMGYLARAVATLIMKPIQSAEINGPAERALALNSQINIIFRRGFTVEGADILWKAIVPYAAHVSLPKGGFSIPVSVLRLHPQNGGLGLCPPGQYSESVDLISILPTYQACGEGMAVSVPTNMSDDWIRTISGKVKFSFDAAALTDMVHKSNVTDSLRPKDKLIGLTTLEESLRDWKANLTLPRVVCSSRLMEEFLQVQAHVPVLERYLRDCTSGRMHKRNEKLGGVIRTINLAITLSPFKNISAASVSLKGDWASIVRACLAMCNRPAVQDNAIISFNQMMCTVGPAVSKLLLDGQNVGVGYFEFKWHPVILSWVAEMAKERAASILMQNRVVDVPKARKLVQKEFDDAMRVLNEWDGMREVSRY